MLPVVTVSPAYFLMPRRLAFESRPFLTDPWPFLCAMTYVLNHGIRVLNLECFIVVKTVKSATGLCQRSSAVGAVGENRL
jgi:hypothetical protein